MSSGTASYRCSMSSSADLSEEEDLSQKSGTGSPAPGDTLPWNLPKHERSKRKIHGGSVLDPAERAVLRIAGKGRMGPTREALPSAVTKRCGRAGREGRAAGRWRALNFD
ncbi:microtubule-actin cross-linking factor 1-like, partial [Meleagris gallopavo]|uniref:microtubule-actin cross-linking factor 1-like n=1 Tax=Meleagris gallopavo TaxID=9103 RepID=UPI000939D9AC